MPFLTLGTPRAVSGRADFIGVDYVSLAIVGGINLRLDDHWSIDFEFIAVGDFLRAQYGVPATVFVLDPGVIYNWGPLWTGLRMAMRVGMPISGAEFGFVPIVGKAFKIHDLFSYYVELDFPLFFHAPPGVSFTVFLQTGLGF